MNSFQIQVPQPVLSRNTLDKMHWAQRQQIRLSWMETIRYEGFRSQPLPKIDKPVKLTITSFRQKLLDHDNLVGGCKPLLDALKHLGLIVDDQPEWITVQYEQRKGYKKPKTLIEMEIL